MKKPNHTAILAIIIIAMLLLPVCRMADLHTVMAANENLSLHSQVSSASELQEITAQKDETELNIAVREADSWPAGILVTVTLTSGGSALEGKEVVCRVDSDTYMGITDSQGQIVQTVKLVNGQKTVTVEAEFKGDDAYAASKESTAYKTGKEEGTLELGCDYSADNPLVLTYGTKAVTLSFSLKKGKDEVGEDLTESTVTTKDDSIVGADLDVNGRSIRFTPRKAAETPVEVKLSLQTESYEFAKTVYVKVVPYPLTVNAGSVAVSAPGRNTFTNRKIYDATGLVDVRASLERNDELQTTSAAKKEIADLKNTVFFSYDSGITNVSDGTAPQAFTFAPADLSDASVSDSLKNNYTIKSGEKADTTIRIVRRTLKLTVAATKRPFRSLEYDKNIQSLVRVDKADEDTGFAGADSADLEGFAYPTVLDTTAAGLTGETVKKKDSAVYGVHKEALILDTGTGNSTGNYSFDLAGYAKGALTITEETEGLDYVSVNNEGSIHVYETKGGACRYFGPGTDGRNTRVKFTLGGGYNKIFLADGTDITDNGTVLTADKTTIYGEKKSLKVYLSREESIKEGDAPVIMAKTGVFDIPFVYDGDAPLCKKISFGTVNRVIDNLQETVTFGIYDYKPLTADVEFIDTGAGMKCWSYYVADVTEDTVFEDLLFTEDYGETTASTRFTEGTDDGKIPVGTLPAGQLARAGSRYVVLVRAMDNVGNVRIYGSNGIVLENLHDISIAYTENPVDATLQKGEWKGINYYAGDTGLRLHAEENARKDGYYSGLAGMAYTVSRQYGDGTAATERKQMKNEKGFPDEVTLETLHTYYRTIDKELIFENDENKSRDDKLKRSQVITVSATAWDNAGNSMAVPAEHTFVLDPVVPKVTSSYAQQNNGGAFLNSRYANSNVTYTAEVKERFLKELIILLNGNSYTLSELKAQKDRLGIASVFMDEAADITKTTDDTVYRFTIVFAADGSYTVQTKATDAAGNEGADMPFSFTIDTVRPELEVTYTAYHNDGSATVLDTSTGRVYADETVSCVTATAVITEMNFDANGTAVKYSAVNSKNKTVQVADFDAAIRGQWTHKGCVSENDDRMEYELTLPAIQVDANYDFTYSCTDLAGNTLRVDPVHAITLDRVKPEGTVTAENLVNGTASKIWKKLLSAITFGYFGRHNIRVAMTSGDETSGVALVQYLRSVTPLTRDELEKRVDWTDYKTGLTYNASQHLVVYEKITDMAGNIQYISTDGIIVDNADPVPVISVMPTAPAWGKGVYSAGDDPGFNVTVADPVINDTYAGLKKITYKIVNGTNGNTETGTLAEITKAAHKQEWTGHVDIDPNTFCSNDVQVTVYAEDWSANTATSEKIRMKVDSKAPVVKFTFDKGDGHNGQYYKNDKKLTITVDEENFDDSYRPIVTSSAGGGYKISKWTHKGETHTAVITFTGDSDYTVTYSCYDLAGNKSNTERQDKFTVDKTAPVIRVAYDNNSALNGSYYKAARTATITVTEHNFDPARITVHTTASTGNAPKIGNWIAHGDTHTARVSFNHDASYTFSVEGLDLADNKAADYGQDKFTVDLTAPDISVAGVEDNSANNGTVAPVITIKDTNFIAVGTEVTLTGANTGEKNVKSMASIRFAATGMTVRFDNFASGMDDIYTLRCKSVDMAGNETEISLRFSVNRDGSAYEIHKDTQQLLDKGYTNRPQDIVITEINADTLKQIEISYSLDGRVITLKQGTEYTVEVNGQDGQWKKYVYKIKAGCFETEGTYILNIYSEDNADNTTTNKSKAKTITFTVDNTAPTMAVSNLTDGGRYKEETHQFTLHVKDNISLAYVKLYLDGKSFHTYKEEELTATDGQLPITIDSSNQYQTIQLVSCDKAGNISRKVYHAETNTFITATYKVLITANYLIQFIHNIPLLISSIPLLLSLATFNIILIQKHRAKKEE